MLRIAKREITSLGHGFFLQFVSSCGNACELRSRWPAGYWLYDGKVCYYSIWEYIGPHTTGGEDLRLLKLWVNKCPVPSVVDRIRIVVQSSIPLCNSPCIELCCVPDELPLFGSWVYEWFMAHHTPGAPAPKPPVPFGDDGAHKPATAWARRDDTWRRYDYIWTAAAIADISAMMSYSSRQSSVDKSHCLSSN